MQADTEAIRTTLNAYRDALVSSNTSAIVPLYTEDGVTMAQGFPSQIGHDSIEAWYNKCFELITLNVTFDIKEVIVVSDQYGFARTSSTGTQKQNATGQTSHEGNQELFVMRKISGVWKIARYCFSTTNPPK